jgi:hypothetical protein
MNPTYISLGIFTFNMVNRVKTFSSFCALSRSPPARTIYKLSIGSFLTTHSVTKINTEKRKLLEALLECFKPIVLGAVTAKRRSHCVTVENSDNLA